MNEQCADTSRKIALNFIGEINYWEVAHRPWHVRDALFNYFMRAKNPYPFLRVIYAEKGTHFG